MYTGTVHLAIALRIHILLYIILPTNIEIVMYSIKLYIVQSDRSLSLMERSHYPRFQVLLALVVTCFDSPSHSFAALVQSTVCRTGPVYCVKDWSSPSLCAFLQACGSPLSPKGCSSLITTYWRLYT